MQQEKKGGLTTQTLQALSRQSASLVHSIRTQFMYNTRNRSRIRQHSRHLPHTPLIINCLEFPRIQESIPIRHVHHEIIILWSGVREFREEATRDQVMIIFVDLSDCLADLEMGFKVVHPVFLRAIQRDTAVGTFEVGMGRWEGSGGYFLIFGSACRCASLLMARMRTERILLNECSSFPDYG